MTYEQRFSELGLQLTVLAMLSALRLALGSLDRVRDWVTATGFANADLGYPQTTAVLVTP